jgi:hypothetical protein
MNHRIPQYHPLPDVEEMVAIIKREKFGYRMPPLVVESIIRPCVEVMLQQVMQATRPPMPNNVSDCGDCGALLHLHYKHCPGCGNKINWSLHMPTQEHRITQSLKTKCA